MNTNNYAIDSLPITTRAGTKLYYYLKHKSKLNLNEKHICTK